MLKSANWSQAVLAGSYYYQGSNPTAQLLFARRLANKMPTFEKDHTLMQESVCMCCFTKPKKGLRFALRKISDTIAGQLKEHVLKDYGEVDKETGKFCINKKWGWLPTVVCDSCRKRLRDGSKVYFEGLLRGVNSNNYSDLTEPRPLTRATDGVCTCSVCTIGRHTGTEHKRHSDEAKNAPYQKANSTHSGAGATPHPIKVCSECLGPFTPGVSHRCNSTSTRENVTKILDQLDPKTKQQVLVESLKGVFDAEGQSTRGGTVSLSTGGKRISATLGQVKHAPQVFFTNEAMRRLQIKCGLSDNAAKTLAGFIRIHAGRASVEALQREYLFEQNNMLRGFFEHKNVMMTEYFTPEGADKKVKEKRWVSVPVAYCSEVEGLAMEVMLARDLDPADTLAQIGLA